jgi:glycosyltransferase involved in cell wall biosynthesis/O-antigen/teichoic acid export membrane protein
LHIKKEQAEEIIEEVSEKVEETKKFAFAALISQAIEQTRSSVTTPLSSVSPKFIKNFTYFSSAFQKTKNWKTLAYDLIRGKYQKGVFLVTATMAANFLNMATNIYLGQELSIEDFALYNTFLSILNIVAILFSALSTTINQQAATLYAKLNQSSIRAFWEYHTNRYILYSIGFSILWVISFPLLNSFFRFHSYFPLLVFTPIFILGGLTAINQGYLRGKLAFQLVAVTTVAQPLARLITAVLFGESALDHFAYFAIPIGFFVACLISYHLSSKGEDIHIAVRQMRLPSTFFSLVILTNLSSIAFFTLDNIFVAHHLSDYETGLYGIMGVLGKMIYFSGGLITGFILPITAFQEGKGLSSSAIFRKLLALNFVVSGLAWLVIGVLLPLYGAPYFGEKINAIKSYLPYFTLGILLYTLSQSIVQYHLAKKHYLFAITAFTIAIFQVIGLQLFHSSLNDVVMVMLFSGFVNFIVLLLLHYFYDNIKGTFHNLYDLRDLFFEKVSFHHSYNSVAREKYRILIFNWRDTKHAWSGGAETYTHEIAKGLVEQGHKVTLFCGNDGKNPRNEVVDGIQVIRRGGFCTVYIWAFLYYILKLRKYFDIIIDSENGVPFLTPLYAHKPIYLLIHHVHQEVFRTHLVFPFSEIASIIEAELMPLLYRNHSVITVSNSSKKEIIGLGLGDSTRIGVVHPGIHSNQYALGKKTSHPSVIYVGRLKPYKNIDVAIKAFAQIKKGHPMATFTIAGIGESKKQLVKLVANLELQDSVHFLNKVSETDKVKLLAESWVAVQPSMIEGWGITVIEANACGTPVVASNVKGLRDSVNDGLTGVLATPQNVESFAAALSELLSDKKKLRRMSKEAKKWSSNFDWKVSAKRINQILTQTEIREQNSEEISPTYA